MADSSEAPEVVVVFATFPSPEKATEVARILVTEGLAACANLVPPVRSIYRWDGKVEEADEILAILKTTRERFDAMKDRLVELHSYDVPEVIGIPTVGGHAPYLAWVVDSTK